TSVNVVHSYGREKYAVNSLYILGQVCADSLVLLNHKAGNAAEAKKHFEAAFALGAKLYRERVCWVECDAGLSLMGRTAPALAKLAEAGGDAEAAKRWRDFDAARISYTEKRINPM